MGAGTSAAPAMTRPNAMTRPATAGVPEPIGSWNTRMPPMIAAAFAATEVSAITSTPSPIWRLVSVQGLSSPRSGPGGAWVRYLIATSETPQSAPAAGRDPHRQEDEPAGEDRLHDRQRRERERADVQTPGHDRHEPADGKPLGAKESRRASQRMADLDRRGEHRAAVLEPERPGWWPAPKRARASVRESRGAAPSRVGRAGPVAGFGGRAGRWISRARVGAPPIAPFAIRRARFDQRVPPCAPPRPARRR